MDLWQGKHDWGLAFDCRLVQRFGRKQRPRSSKHAAIVSRSIHWRTILVQLRRGDARTQHAGTPLGVLSESFLRISLSGQEVRPSPSVDKCSRRGIRLRSSWARVDVLVLQRAKILQLPSTHGRADTGNLLQDAIHDVLRAVGHHLRCLLLSVVAAVRKKPRVNNTGNHGQPLEHV